MRKIVLLAALVLTAPLYATAQSAIDKTVAPNPPEDGKKGGLVSYLTYVKTIGEFKMTGLATNVEYKKQLTKAQEFNSAYNLLKLATDKLVNQLSADLYSKNRLGLYKALDAHLKTGNALPTKYAYYQKLVEEVDGRLGFLMFRSYGSAAGVSVEEITAIAELGHGIVTDARDFREKKIQSITGLLKELRLAKLVDLTKPTETEKEEKG